jgi:hypothetical protein
MRVPYPFTTHIAICAPTYLDESHHFGQIQALRRVQERGSQCAGSSLHVIKFVICVQQGRHTATNAADSAQRSGEALSAARLRLRLHVRVGSVFQQEVGHAHSLGDEERKLRGVHAFVCVCACVPACTNEIKEKERNAGIK